MNYIIIFSKMWIFAIGLILCPIAVFGEDFCNTSPHEACPIPIDKHFENIKNPQDVKDICPKFIEHIACLGNYDETCLPRRMFPNPGEFESVRDLVADICDEESLLHTALTENIKCLKEGMFNEGNNTCYTAKRDVLKAYRDLLEQTPLDYEDSEYREEYSCVTHLYDASCYIEYLMNNCGPLTKDAVIEILHRSYFLRIFCPPETAVKFAEDVENLEMSDPLKDIFNELLRKILKTEA